MRLLAHAGKPRIMKKEYDFEKMKEVKNPYLGKKKSVGINLSPQVIDYFKKMGRSSISVPRKVNFTPRVLSIIEVSRDLRGWMNVDKRFARAIERPSK